MLRRAARRLHRYRDLLLVGVGIVSALVMLLLLDASKPPPQRLTQDDIDAAVVRAIATITPGPFFATHVYETIRPSLVLIRAFIAEDASGEGSLGTGVVIDDTGTILSSLHVVRDAAAVRVVFADGTETEATVVLKQPENDLAVLSPKVIPDDLVPATLTSAASLRIGDEVVAVGNPFGIMGSLSSGVVSGLGRRFRSPKSGEMLSNLIQFDAAVNPGSSGGPLLNRDGEVVGIVTALLNPKEQDVFIGIGFAVPIETAEGALGSPPY